MRKMVNNYGRATKRGRRSGNRHRRESKLRKRSEFHMHKPFLFKEFDYEKKNDK